MQIILKKTLSLIIKKTEKYILRYPALAYKIKPLLKRHSQLWSYIKQETFYKESSDSKNDYHLISLAAINLLFSTLPLKDRRGIGRFTQNLLHQFILASKTHKPHNTDTQIIYFYSSIHWCPTKLPENSVVMIMDVIPLLFPEFDPESCKYWKNRYKPIAQQVKAIVTISETSAVDIARLLELPKEKIHVIPCGVSLLPIAKTPTVTLPTSPYIVFLGSGDNHKNLRIVLQALQDPTLKDITLIMIGDNKKYKRQAKQLGVHQQVQFLGRLNDEQVGYVISRALAFVFPSLYEGFGLPPLEAALLGVPSICSRRPAMTELLQDAALFAEPDDAPAWAAAIRSLLDDADLRTRLAHAARQRAETYTWERAGQQFLQLFASLTDPADPHTPCK